MFKNYKYISIIFLAGLLFFSSVSFAFALEIRPESYPRLPFAQPITVNSELPQYVSYFFSLGIYLAGALAVISLAIGGIQLMMSSGNVGSHGEAIDRIKGSILGLILTASSFIILTTINPALETITLTALPGLAGVFYTNNSEEKPAPTSESNTENIPEGFKTIFYKCSESGGGIGPALFVWRFPQKNFGDSYGYPGTTTSRLTCGQTISVNNAGGIYSFKTAFETPGVYYFNKPGCQGFMSPARLANSQVPEPFKDNDINSTQDDIKSIRIVNDIANNNNYGVILHENVDFRGKCSAVLKTGDELSKCFDIFPPSSADIFIFNKDKPETSGNGVIFYSKPFGYKTGANAGYYFVKPLEIGNIWGGNPERLSFFSSYINLGIPREEQELCPTFKECSGSIKVQGNYLIALYSGFSSEEESSFCQVFYKDTPNLKTEEVSAEGKIIKTITIIPLK